MDHLVIRANSFQGDRLFVVRKSIPSVSVWDLRRETLIAEIGCGICSRESLEIHVYEPNSFYIRMDDGVPIRFAEVDNQVEFHKIFFS